MNNELYIGVMSGTSLDGVDIVLCEINENSLSLLHAKEYPFETALKEEILHTIHEAQTLKKLGELNHKIGLLYAKTILAFLKEFKLTATDITAIGLHGQTLWHEPNSNFPFSMQLGDPNIVVAKTKIKTIADFRGMDIAHGGQGAPFAPAFHKFLFASLSENVAVVNIGGMANITLLEDELKGWDSGCGNVLLDMWIDQTQGKAFDKAGSFAKSGTLNKELFNAMIDDKYFKQKAPKSTGREYFNETWLANHLPIFHTISDQDIQRTLLEVTAKSIANDINETSTDKLIVCGGGAKNSFLMQRLDKLCNCEVVISDTLGVNSDYLEAEAFAWFAYKRVHGEVLELHSVTGAKKDVLAGAIYG